MKNSKRIAKLIIILFAGSFLLLSCINPFTWYDPKGGDDDPGEDTEPSKIKVVGISFTLAWDQPSGESVTGYIVYFRDHGDSSWTELDELSGTITEYTVTYPDLDYGKYDFAVTSLNNGEESNLHTSLDPTAEPDTGWYLDWRES